MRYLIMVMIIVGFAGCATVDPIDKPLEPFQFEKEEVYVLDTSKLQETEPPAFILLVQDANGNFREAESNETPSFVALSQEELSKIDAVVTLKNAYKDISKEQAFLINIERDKCSALKEILALERQSRQVERELRLDSEKAYRAERRDHRLDNIVNRATLILTVIGGVAIAAL